MKKTQHVQKQELSQEDIKKIVGGEHIPSNLLRFPKEIYENPHLPQ